MAVDILRDGGTHARAVRRPAPELPAPDAQPNFVRYPDLRILDLLAMFMTHWGGELAAYPSITTLCRKMREKFNRHMCERTMIRHLNSLERDLYIRRQVRHRFDRGINRWTFRSTLYRPLGRMKDQMLRAAERTGRMLQKLSQPSAVTRYFRDGTPAPQVPDSRVTFMAEKLMKIFTSVLRPAASRPSTG